MSVRQFVYGGCLALASVGLVIGCKPKVPPGPQKPTAPAQPGASEYSVVPGSPMADASSESRAVSAEVTGAMAKVEPSAAIAVNAAPAAPRIPIAAVFMLPAAESGDEKLAMDDLKALLDDPHNHEPFVPQAPLGLGDVAGLIPAENPMTRAKVELGRMLYFDKRLSRDSSVSCASCHDPSSGWAQNRQFAAGIDGQEGGRNSPTVMNRIFGTKVQFWDGRAASLEEQSLGPIQNPIEMGFNLEELVERLKGIEGYRMAFARVFQSDSGPGEISPENIAKAIATFERMVLVGDSPYDYFNQAEPFRRLSREDLEGDPELAAKAKEALAAADAHPLSESARRGRDLFFGKANCTACHAGVNFADELFHNIGIGMENPKPDAGRHAVTRNAAETAAFKTPTVRNVAFTAPYMHDGSQKTLMEVVEYYNQGGRPNPHQSERIKKLNLTEQEKADLLAYMTEGLSGTMPDIRAPKLP